jgi:hypothetical protein
MLHYNKKYYDYFKEKTSKALSLASNALCCILQGLLNVTL